MNTKMITALGSILNDCRLRFARSFAMADDPPPNNRRQPRIMGRYRGPGSCLSWINDSVISKEKTRKKTPSIIPRSPEDGSPCLNGSESGIELFCDIMFKDFFPLDILIGKKGCEFFSNLNVNSKPLLIHKRFVFRAICNF